MESNSVSPMPEHNSQQAPMAEFDKTPPTPPEDTLPIEDLPPPPHTAVNVQEEKEKEANADGSGYGLSNYLLTPLANPIIPGEQLYNEALIRTRTSIETTFGIWKRWFPVMAYGLCLILNTVLTIIVAASVLHNIAKEMNEPEPSIIKI